VTRGQVGVKEALIVGAVLALMAFLLVLTTNGATIAWSFVALTVALLYPYAKRYVAMPQAVLGIAFSFGIPMAFSAVRGADELTWAAMRAGVPAQAWTLLMGNLFWVLAYDTEYAMVDRDDDLRIGMKTSAITLGRWDVPIVALCYLAYLVIWGWVLGTHLHTWLYQSAIAFAGMQAAWHVWLIRRRDRQNCFRAFRLNHWLGLTLFLGVAGSGLMEFPPAT
jgi:4-hydroxybenzoate polyprenyltransferase